MSRTKQRQNIEHKLAETPEDIKLEASKVQNLDKLYELEEGAAEQNKKMREILNNFKENKYLSTEEFSVFIDNLDPIVDGTVEQGRLQALRPEYEAVSKSIQEVQQLLDNYHKVPEKPQYQTTEWESVDLPESLEKIITTTSVVGGAIGGGLLGQYLSSTYGFNPGGEVTNDGFVFASFVSDIISSAFGIGVGVGKLAEDEEAGCLGGMLGAIGGGATSLAYHTLVPTGIIAGGGVGAALAKPIKWAVQKSAEGVKYLVNKTKAGIKNGELRHAYNQEISEYNNIPKNLRRANQEFSNAANVLLTKAQAYDGFALSVESKIGKENVRSMKDLKELETKYNNTIKLIQEVSEAPGFNLLDDEFQVHSERPYSLWGEYRELPGDKNVEPSLISYESLALSK